MSLYLENVMSEVYEAAEEFVELMNVLWESEQDFSNTLEATEQQEAA